MKFIALLLLLMVLPVAAQEDTPMNTQSFYTTHPRPDGNRILAGRGTFPAVRRLDFRLEGVPAWIVATDQSLQIALEDGRSFSLNAQSGMWTLSPVAEATLPASAPPAFTIDSAGQTQLILPPAESSALTHPIPLDTALLSITQTGAVLLTRAEAELDHLPLNAVPDARPVVSVAGQIALYVAATNQRYVHGIMGDDLEGAALVVLTVVDDKLHTMTRIDLPGEDVFEGLSPLWADVDGDGVDDLVTTVSNGSGGAQLRVYHADGRLLANGPAIGRGGRWRHQLAFGPFGPAGESELVDVLTPHIGGVVEFFRFDGTALTLAAALGGYTSHVIGSRNLDMALAGDFNGDGHLEMVMPDQTRGRIASLQRTADGVAEVWSVDLEGTLATNLAALTLDDGRLALAAGTDTGRLHLWLPE